MGPETRNRNLDASQGDWEDCQNPEQEDGRPSGITGTHITAGPRGGICSTCQLLAVFTVLLRLESSHFHHRQVG